LDISAVALYPQPRSPPFISKPKEIGGCIDGGHHNAADPYSSGDNDVLGQGGLEQVAQNNDQLQVQNDIAVKNLALDWSNAAQSNHCSAVH
jgi:hypothetical protein